MSHLATMEAVATAMSSFCSFFSLVLFSSSILSIYVVQNGPYGHKMQFTYQIHEAEEMAASRAK